MGKSSKHPSLLHKQCCTYVTYAFPNDGNVERGPVMRGRRQLQLVCSISSKAINTGIVTRVKDGHWKSVQRDVS